ncbi:hypothetical protein GGS21DRAFT_492629 [Xylaria nigripes]|nr:hypothetical protein GGS21DRAFT_492629 [Xylaria nigripes]
MASKRQANREAPSRQPRRSVRNANKKGRVEAREPVTRPAPGGLRKNAGKRKDTAATEKRCKQLQQALLDKVDTRDPKIAWAEQAGLLGLPPGSPPSPISPKKSKPSKAEARRVAREEKYVDDMLVKENEALAEDPDRDLKREERWIPTFAQRKRTIEKPLCVSYSVWMAYRHLDEIIYRSSLSREELLALPLLEEVYEYQDKNGQVPRPITPPGFRWNENLELELVSKGFSKVEVEISQNSSQSHSSMQAHAITPRVGEDEKGENESEV